jgi:hypothetical protein
LDQPRIPAIDDFDSRDIASSTARKQAAQPLLPEQADLLLGGKVYAIRKA